MKYKYNGQWVDVNIKALDSMVIGSIIQFIGTTIPTGWLECNGATITQSDYPELYSLIGGTLPDFRGRVLVGQDTNDTDFDTLGETGGSKELQEHRHSLETSSGTSTKLVSTAYSGTTGWGATNGSSMVSGGDILSQTSNAGTGNSGNLQPYAVVKHIIKAKNTTPTMASIVNATNNSTTDGYSCDYINKNNTYSTDEVKTNRLWTNGKPIYRRCYNARITTQTANIDINNFVADVESIVSLTGGTKGNNYSYGFYWKDNSDHYLAILNQNTTNLNIQIGTSYPAVPFNATVIVEYTKTTD